MNDKYLPEEDALLINLRKSGVQFPNIAIVLNRTSCSVSSRYYRLMGMDNKDASPRSKGDPIGKDASQKPMILQRMKDWDEKAAYAGVQYDDIPQRFIEWENRSKRFNYMPRKPEMRTYTGCGLADLRGSGL